MQDNSSTFNFKVYLKYWLKIALFIILLILTITFIGKKYSSASTENIINAFNKQRFNDFYALPENSLDMVFLGSSHSYCTFDPEIFDTNLGTNSFQLGMPLQLPSSTYYTLKEVLNYQKPEVVVMEVYWDLLQTDFELNQAKTLFQVLDNDELIDEYINNTFPLAEKIKYDFNIFRYQADYIAFKGNEYQLRLENKFNIEKEKSEKQIGVEEYRSKGYVYCNYNMLSDEYDKTNQFKGVDGDDFVFSNVQKEFLLKIIDLCKENNINLIFVTAPIANVSLDFIKNYDTIHSQIAEFAEDNGIFYIDYNIVNQKEHLVTTDNFRDDAHLNHSGVEIISNHFLKILKNMK